MGRLPDKSPTIHLPALTGLHTKITHYPGFAPMYHEGDIVEIPLPDGRIAIGWILHISKHFKDAVGFIVFGIKGQIREDVVLHVDSG